MGQRVKLFLWPGQSSRSQTVITKPPPEALLVRDIEETHSWARLGFLLHFGWFALLLAVNGVVVGLFITSWEDVRLFATALCIVFIGVNLVGVVGTVLLVGYLLECGTRVQEINRKLLRMNQSRDSFSESLALIPRTAIKILFGFTGLVLLLLLILWAILLRNI